MIRTLRDRRPGGPGPAAVLLAVLVALAGAPGTAHATPAAPVTYQGSSYPAAGPSPTEDKPQSKLWHTDGSWWAVMRVPAGVTIHRLLADHTWQDTGVVVDDRIASTADVLWEAGTLHVASRVSSGAIRALQFSYDPTADTWTRLGQQQVSASGTESTTVARDGLGRSWVAFTQGGRVHVARTAADGTTWTAPFLVPVPDNTVTADDISAVIAFNGRIGVMWSDQGDDVVRFAVHVDTAPDGAWTVESALSGPNVADDHLNLKSLLEDDQGRVYAAVKTSRGDAGEPPTDPSVVVLQRASDGTWTWAPAATVGDRLTRPQLALDRTNRRVHVVMSTESGGTVYHKSAPLGALSFDGGKGTPFITWSGASINNATTTKQPVGADTGLVVLASDDDAGRYYHGELALGGATDSAPPSVPADVSATATSATSVNVTWAASTDDVGVVGYRLFRDGVQVGTATGTQFTDTGLTPGTTHTWTVAAADAAGNVSAQSSGATAAASEQAPGTAAFVGASTATSSGTTTAVAAPPGVQAGDLLVGAVSSRGAPAVSAGEGWTRVREDSNGTTVRQVLFVRVATGTSADASTWTLSRAQDHVVEVLAYRGVDAAEPVIASAGAVSSTAAIPHPAVAAVDGALVVAVASTARSTALDPVDPLVERAEVRTASTASYQLTAAAADSTARGTTAGPFTTTAGAGAAGIGQTLTLRPAAGGGGQPAPDTTPPSTPTGLSATAVSGESVQLAWDAATDDVGVTGYRVLRDGVHVATPSATAHTDGGLAAGTTYSYRVVALDAAGNASPPSAPATATTAAPAGAAATFVAAATATSATTTTTVASPAGVQAGDVLVAAVSHRGTAVITPARGWTLVRSDANGTTLRQALYVAVATGPAAGSTWTLDRAQTTTVQVLAYRGIDTTAPVVASSGASTSTTTLTSPAVDGVAGGPVLSLTGLARTTSLAPRTPLTERSEITSSSTAKYKLTAAAADATAAGGPAGPYTTVADRAAGGVAQTVSLRPRG